MLPDAAAQPFWCELAARVMRIVGHLWQHVTQVRKWRHAGDDDPRVRVYVLADVWLAGQEGHLIHTTKGAHKNRVVTAEAKK
jgi:hypothetical protein